MVFSPRGISVHLHCRLTWIMNLAVLKHTRGAWYIFWDYWGGHSGYVLAGQENIESRSTSSPGLQYTADHSLWRKELKSQLSKSCFSHKTPSLAVLGFSHEGFYHVWIWQSLINMYISSIHSDLTVCGSWFFFLATATRRLHSSTYCTTGLS